MKLRLMICAAVTTIAIAFFSSRAFATLYFDPVEITGNKVNHTYGTDEGTTYANDYLIGNGTNGEAAPSITCDMMADPQKQIVFTINAPAGKKITINPPGTGNGVRFISYLNFTSGAGGGSPAYTQNVAFENLEGSVTFSDSAGHIWANTNYPRALEFSFFSELSGPVSFTSMTVTMDYSSATLDPFPIPLTYNYDFGYIYARWYANEGTPNPGQFLSVVDAVPEPSAVGFLITGLLGLAGILKIKNNRRL